MTQMWMFAVSDWVGPTLSYFTRFHDVTGWNVWMRARLRQVLRVVATQMHEGERERPREEQQSSSNEFRLALNDIKTETK